MGGYYESGSALEDISFDLKVGEISISYESTISLDSVIDTASSNRIDFKGKITRGGVTTNYLFQVGNTVRTAQYSEVEKATTQVYITGTWV